MNNESKACPANTGRLRAEENRGEQEIWRRGRWKLFHVFTYYLFYLFIYYLFIYILFIYYYFSEKEEICPSGYEPKKIGESTRYDAEEDENYTMWEYQCKKPAPAAK